MTLQTAPLSAMQHIYQPQKFLLHTKHYIALNLWKKKVYVILHLTEYTCPHQPVLSQKQRKQRTLKVHQKGLKSTESRRAIVSRCLKEILEQEKEKEERIGCDDAPEIYKPQWGEQVE